MKKNAKKIQVYSRFRPPITDWERHQTVSVKFEEGNTVLVNDEKHRKVLRFEFDGVFPPDTTQQQVYDTVAASLLDDVFDGFNSCIITYGQTGTGKTYTMEGPGFQLAGKDTADTGTDEDLSGIVPRLIQNIFDRVEQLTADGLKAEVFASFVEVYKEKLHDCLDGGSETPKIAMPTRRNRLPHLSGHKVVQVTECAELLQLYRTGVKERVVYATNANPVSSRGHGVFDIHLTITAGVTSTHSSLFRLVDLAGSEQAENTGDDAGRKAEAKFINTSLTALGSVVTALAKNVKTIHYRTSLLTRVLEECLGGNSKSLLLVTGKSIAPAVKSTLNSLRFAAVATAVRGAFHKNVTVTKKQLQAGLLAKERELAALRLKMQGLTGGMDGLRAELDRLKNKAAEPPDVNNPEAAAELREQIVSLKGQLLDSHSVAQSLQNRLRSSPPRRAMPPLPPPPPKIQKDQNGMPAFHKFLQFEDGANPAVQQLEAPEQDKVCQASELLVSIDDGQSWANCLVELLDSTECLRCSPTDVDQLSSPSSSPPSSPSPPPPSTSTLSPPAPLSLSPPSPAPLSCPPSMRNVSPNTPPPPPLFAKKPALLPPKVRMSLPPRPAKTEVEADDRRQTVQVLASPRGRQPIPSKMRLKEVKEVAVARVARLTSEDKTASSADVFVIRAQGEKVLFRASSPAECSTWITSLREAKERWRQMERGMVESHGRTAAFYAGILWVLKGQPGESGWERKFFRVCKARYELEFFDVGVPASDEDEDPEPVASLPLVGALLNDGYRGKYGVAGVFSITPEESKGSLVVRARSDEQKERWMESLAMLQTTFQARRLQRRDSLMLPTSVQEGVLLRREKGVFWRWKERYCVVTPSRQLLVFSQKHSTIAQALMLHDCTLQLVEDSKRLTIQLRTSRDEQHAFRCEDSKTLRKWWTSLNLQ